MPAVIDRNKTHLIRQHGDIKAVYTWWDGERAMVLMPAHREGRWFIVCDSAAFRYDDPQYMARKCAEAAEYMGFTPDKATWVRIATIINEGLQDLIRMPSEPDWTAQVKAQEFGVLKVREAGSGAVVHEEALTIAPQQGAEYVPA